jgi:hypothetical protein
MDECAVAQSPVELLFILAALADEGIPLQTVAPKFSGRFNKGVDYEGDIEGFSRELESDLAVVAFAATEFSLPRNLKLSVHSGSDKFSLYHLISRAIKKSGTGIHVKTAGTTWLAEVEGLAAAGGDGLDLAKTIYAVARARTDELCGPYAAVIDIDPRALPAPETVAGWSEDQFTRSLHHNQSCPDYNPSFRQLLHVGYKVAAEMGDRYLAALDKHREVVARTVSENIFQKHLVPLFISA